jgi:hypothetical protein
MMNTENTVETEEQKVYVVPEANFPQLEARIAKLNKRAAKLNCSPIVITTLGQRDIEVKHQGPFQDETRIRRVFDTTVSGQAPKINGWEFIAVIQPALDEAGKALGNILRGVPGASVQVPAQYRNAQPACEHCHTARRRNETYILHSDAGDTKQVGRNCLRDFLGHQSPEAYAAMAEMLLDAADLCRCSEDDDFCVSGRQQERFYAEEILALAACSVRLNGWRSNATAREYGTLSTSGEVSNWLWAKSAERQKWEKKLVPSDEDKATAKEVTEWLQQLSSREELNEYMYNLSILGQGATFTTKNFGLACSAIPTYLREMEQEINRRKRFESDANSQYIGTEGERIEKLTLTLVFTRDCESQYGVTHLYKFKDDAGNVCTWFASNVYFNTATNQDINIGDTIVVTATVKGHEEYKGVKQTMLTRCKEFKTKEQKKAEAKVRKAGREKVEAEYAAAARERDQERKDWEAVVANNCNFFHSWEPNTKKLYLTAEHGDEIASAL